MLLIYTQALPELGSKDLLVHHVPVAVPYLELTRIFPGNPEIHVSSYPYYNYSLTTNEVVDCFFTSFLTLALLCQEDIKVQGDFYSTFVKFKNANQADNAFEGLKGKICQVGQYLFWL